eukprot:UN13330
MSSSKRSYGYLWSYESSTDCTEP